MAQLHSYLTFNGNCKEALLFYRECLGGKITLQTIGESPFSATMPQKMKDCVLHATLQKDNLVLMASDMVSDNGLIKGNNVSLSLSCNSEKEMRSWYKKLSQGGVVNHPIEENFWGILLGNLTDKYGNHWMLSFNKKSLHQNKKT